MWTQGGSWGRVGAAVTLILLSSAVRHASAVVDCSNAAFWDDAVTAFNAGDGAALRSTLHSLIEGHTVIPYTSNTKVDAWDALSALDEDPANSDNVILVYAQRSEPKATAGLSTGWNREHLFPKSYGVGTTGADTSDLHALRAADWGVNSARNNLYYDECDPATDATCSSPAHPEAEATTAKNSQSFQPPAAVRGDIARAIFYMAVRYDGDAADPNTLDIELSNTPDVDAGLMGRLDVLLAWHAADPVDDAERARNTLVCTDFQHNRNPFVEHPEFAAMIDWATYVRNPYPAPTASSQDDDVEEGGYVMQPGDVVLLAFDSDNPDSLTFVPTVDLPEGTVVKFTDSGWDTDAFREGSEGVIKYRVGPDGLSAGTIVRWTGQFVGGWEDGPGTLSLSASGDQILVYGDGYDNPVFVYAVHYAGGGWDTEVTGASDTRLPPGLWDGVTGLSLTHRDNYVYSGPVTEMTRAAFLMQVADVANWAGSDSPVTPTLPATIAILPDVHPDAILLDAIPVYGVDETLSGTIPNPPASAVPGYYKVVTYIFRGGWWVKPWDGWPWFFVGDDWTYGGTFKSHVNDLTSNFIAVALVPVHATAAPLLAYGTPTLPAALEDLAFAKLVVSRGPNVVTFSGREMWEIKHNEPGTSPMGPGPNLFSNDPNDIWVDNRGLHMSISNHGTAESPVWYSTELILRESLGYGTYLFQVVGDIDTLDPYAVVGLFTWEDANVDPHHREIDFEFSRWGSSSDGNVGQFVVQPHGASSLRRYPLSGNSHAEQAAAGGQPDENVVTCVLVWSAGQVHFLSLAGLYDTSTLDRLPSAAVIDEWVFTDTDTVTVPTPGNEQVHINLWQANGIPGFDAAAFEAASTTVRRFEYDESTAPLAHQADARTCAAAGRCWCTSTPPACVEAAADCASPGTCADDQDACVEQPVPQHRQTGLMYHQPSGSLVSDTCEPGPPHYDDCADADLLVLSKAYWRRGGITSGMSTQCPDASA